MKAKKCPQILGEIKDVAFAAVDKNGMPQIHIINVMPVEDEKIYFCTSRSKDFYEQLMRDENVAITGINKDYQMIRLNGKAQKLVDQKLWIDHIFKENPSMNLWNSLYTGKDICAICLRTN